MNIVVSISGGRRLRINCFTRLTISAVSLDRFAVLGEPLLMRGELSSIVGLHVRIGLGDGLRETCDEFGNAALEVAGAPRPLAAMLGHLLAARGVDLLRLPALVQ